MIWATKCAWGDRRSEIRREERFCGFYVCDDGPWPPGRREGCMMLFLACMDTGQIPSCHTKLQSLAAFQASPPLRVRPRIHSHAHALLERPVCLSAAMRRKSRAWHRRAARSGIIVERRRVRSLILNLAPTTKTDRYQECIVGARRLRDTGNE